MELSKEAKALETHNRAKSYYAIAEQYSYRFFMELKKIRDELMFMHLESNTFENYCKKNFGLDDYYVQERIQIATKLGEKYFDGKYKVLGHSKSLLVAKTVDPSLYLEQEEILNLTVAQLKEKIKNDLEAETKEKEKKEALEGIKKNAEIESDRDYEDVKKICSLCFHHIPLEDTPNQDKRFIRIGHLLYEKYVLPDDETTKESRKKALIRIYRWHGIRLLLANYKKHKKLYTSDKDYKEFIDICILKKI